MAEAIHTEYGQGYSATRATDKYLRFGGRSTRSGNTRLIVGLGGLGGAVIGYLTASNNDDMRGNLVAGMQTVYPDVHDNKRWGNDACTAQVNELVTWAIARYGGKAKVVLSCGSHGGMVGLNFAHAHPDKVQAISLSRPAINLKDIHDNNRGAPYGGDAAQMESVYGGSLAAFNAAEPTHNPANYPADFTMPIKLFYASNDDVATAAAAEAFDTGCASCSAVNMGAIGHTGTPAAEHTQAALDFLRSHA